ncbi:peptide-methionine (S)-S-oxide reductase [Flavobacterium sp. 3HN19-14]|uniref:peptide-methionine (S)-S-oxide reductase n=1 Tax=Flavobacterium sp. 3HN19-14 TaxID=3448133 RepID=UPI003EE200BD
MTYNPDEISYEDLLRIHLSTHNPTTLNRQGADAGTQYRSVIYYKNQEEQERARQIVAEMQAVYEDEIVTEIAPFGHFFKAEAYHQNYYANNATEGYCRAVIDPKLKKFRELFKSKLKNTEENPAV